VIEDAPLPAVAAAARPGASLRDPSGYVFSRGGRVFRGVDVQFSSLLRVLVEQGLLEKLERSGQLIPTRFVDQPELLEALRAQHPAPAGFLEHRKIDTLSYPYEWSISMLADAGIRTLDLQLELLANGYSLKDASAYNIQFEGNNPLFIDIASIERPDRYDLWFALGQFQRMFTFPLLLARDRGWDIRSYFLGAPDGRSEREVQAAWGPIERWRPALLLDVTLPALLAGFAGRARTSDTAKPQDSRSTSAQRANLSRLRRKVRSLARDYPIRGPWARYRASESYGDDDHGLKEHLVDDFLQKEKPGRVLDVGCNIGQYSYLAASHGSQVVAIDADHDAVEVLYRRLRDNPAAITPLVVDVTNPSPAGGVGYGERLRFHDRVRPDCVFALALVHHLLVTGGLRLSTVRDLLWELTGNWLVLEFVPRDDPMFIRLMANRRELPELVDLNRFRTAFEERFELEGEAAIGESGRTLMFLRKR